MLKRFGSCSKYSDALPCCFDSFTLEAQIDRQKVFFKVTFTQALYCCNAFQNGLSPLHMAAQSDHADTARLLLKKGSPPDDVTMVNH